MKIKFQNTVILLVLSVSFLTACGPGQLFGPTLTPTPTNTPTSTLTPTPTLTLVPTLTSTPTATATITASPMPACLATSGKWQSKETSESFGVPSPILTFTVSNCQITSWEIWIFPVPGELLWWQGTSTISIAEEQFSQDEDTGMGIFSFEGIFDSAISSHGTLKFPKGFLVVDYILKEDVSITWTASPAK
ncbi:MAG: hypothetical protein HZB50_10300 [Chloroflexi bacterium]|nr:hypothetical protein [Chloroflexota bacterium]